MRTITAVKPQAAIDLKITATAAGLSSGCFKKLLSLTGNHDRFKTATL
jgi:hypothetical protein